MAWIYQDPKQVKLHGADKAAHYVGWIDPDGKKRCKSCGIGTVGLRNAEKYKVKVEAEMLTGTYQCGLKKTWVQFRQQYEAVVIEPMDSGSRRVMLDALNRFQEIIKPVRVSAIKTQTIDEFRARRREARGKKRGSTISKASVNKELRHLKAALRKAHAWGYLPNVPAFVFEKEPRKLATFVSPEHFARMYAACEKAGKPNLLPYPPTDWWRGLLVMAYMTGWRISELLALRRDDLDLTTGEAVTRAPDNKGRRDEKVRLHPVVVEHLKKLPGFDPVVFPWNQDRRALMEQFADIQEEAGIKLTCAGRHEHTRFCYVYGFHDLRRAFATMNAARLSADALQSLMRHESYLTTQRYINMAKQLDDAVACLHVPEVLKAVR